MNNPVPTSVEAEVKIRISRAAARLQLEAVGAHLLQSERQTDVYFSHPCRDLLAQDKTLRVRTSNSQQHLTYKGPRSKSTIKIRQEIEVLVDGNITALLEHLGFCPVATVIKHRDLYACHTLLCALDKVENLGEFLEIETTQPGALERITELLRVLKLSSEPLIRSSYLELLKEAQ